MVLSWKKAQENEEIFWKSIYVEKKKDVPTYMPITDETALTFSKKTVERFGYSIDSLSGKIVIDVGCGPYGLLRGFTVHAQRTGARPEKMYGVDPLMDTYLKFGTLPVEPFIQYSTAKAESIPLPENSCDFVFSTNVIDHVEDPLKVLQECRRICKKEGKVLFAVHVVKFPFSLLGPALFLIDRNHPHHFSSRRIRKLSQEQFRMVAMKKKATISEDHPEFTIANALREKQKLRNLKRWMSTFVLCLCYFECTK